MAEWSLSSVQLTFALSAGLGCGILIGALLASRRKGAPVASGKNSSETVFLPYVSGEYKMVLVVRNDLKMGKGKVAAQSEIFLTNGYRAQVLTTRSYSQVWACSNRLLQANLKDKSSAAAQMGKFWVYEGSGESPR